MEFVGVIAAIAILVLATGIAAPMIIISILALRGTPPDRRPDTLRALGDAFRALAESIRHVCEGVRSFWR
ncbi:hypothetical protein [Nocardia tengchongensis]|uniref:hypothetical protein n=1 Tax=Nocardia tengchongensis TaxID=2055889 RepID=UPI0036805A11